MTLFRGRVTHELTHAQMVQFDRVDIVPFSE